MRPNQAVSAKACPICQTGLSLSKFQGVEIDYCDTCRGVWLDCGEIDSVMVRNGVKAKPPRQALEKREYREPPLHYDDDDDYRPRYGKPMNSAQRVVLAHRTDLTRPWGRTGMLTQDDKAYYSARAVEERQRRAEANDPAVAAVHAQLAQRYAELVAGDAEPYQLQVVREESDIGLPQVCTADPGSLLVVAGASASMNADPGKDTVR